MNDGNGKDSKQKCYDSYWSGLMSVELKYVNTETDFLTQTGGFKRRERKLVNLFWMWWIIVHVDMDQEQSVTSKSSIL